MKKFAEKKNGLNAVKKYETELIILKVYMLNNIHSEKVKQTSRSLNTMNNEMLY